MSKNNRPPLSIARLVSMAAHNNNISDDRTLVQYSLFRCSTNLECHSSKYQSLTASQLIQTSSKNQTRYRGLELLRPVIMRPRPRSRPQTNGNTEATVTNYTARAQDPCKS